MKITDLLATNLMIFDLQQTTKKGVLDEMIQKLYAEGYISSVSEFAEQIFDRERQTSTGLGDGIAIPHGKSNVVNQAVVLFAKSTKGVPFDSLDGQLVHLFFMIAAPEGANNTHLEALASLSRQLVHPEVIEHLSNASTPEEVQKAFSSPTKEQVKQEEYQTDTTNKPLIVAVTACPTGIAHTYMAEDALQLQAKKMGVDIRVETNGSDGVKNKLTADEINRAIGVIVAADKNVAMARFNGKPLVKRPVSDGVKHPEELINKLLQHEAPIYLDKADEQTDHDVQTTGSIGSQIYTHLMSGVSNMLPFVIGGGIMIALAFLIDQLLGVPKDHLSELGHYHTFAGYFNTIGGAAFSFMLPILAGFIAYSIADRPGLVAGFVAGAIASQGGAGFLGALIGGFLAGYVIQGLKRIFAKVPKSLEGIRTILFYPVFGVFVTGALMLLINIPMKAINGGLNNYLNHLSGTSALLLGALLGGMMAVDLGGPVNKAAYVFGTGTLASSVTSGGSIVMASVMAGGMVPPLAIFVATLLFKNKFSKKDQEAGLTNLIMGASFITEGAIPFAAADPLRMIPSFVIGSAITGGLVGQFAIKLMAPHGGIFVIFLVNRPLFYLLFIAIGALVSGIIIGLWKQPVVEK